MYGAYMTCMEMYLNGAGTGMMIMEDQLQTPKGLERLLRMAPSVWYGVVVGTMTLGTLVQPFGLSTCLGTGTTTLASGWFANNLEE